MTKYEIRKYSCANDKASYGICNIDNDGFPEYLKRGIPSFEEVESSLDDILSNIIVNIEIVKA